MSSFKNRKTILASFLVLATGAFTVPVSAEALTAEAVSLRASNLGVIKGIVRDQTGSAIADATVAIFRAGTTQLIKQVSSAADGSFLAKVVPGRYTVLAVAEGFNPISLSQVDVNRSAELYYGFNLERAGSGNTLPEKRADRNNSKWRIRAATLQRSIYQNTEGDAPVDENATAGKVDSSVEVASPDDEDVSGGSHGQTVVETYFAGTDEGNYSGVNFATMFPAGAKTTVVLAGQTGRGPAAPQRFEASVKYRAGTAHQLKLTTSAGRLGNFAVDGRERPLGQLSFQALDEWTVREGLIVVAGLDYSRFVGAGSDSSLSPRIGLQLDLNSKTRFRTAYTPQSEKRNWAQAIELEDAEIAFQEPLAMDDIFVDRGRPQLNRSRRFEIGIERVLDNKSSIEAATFFDLTPGRGVGLSSLPFDTLDGNGFAEFVGNQQGRSQGVRLVYNRRLTKNFSAAAGYAVGSGQKLSQHGISDPSSLFEPGIFQSMFGEVDADFTSGTSIRTVFRLSPKATVFAIDPFQGRLAIYDPSLSVLVTQKIPTLGLPFHAQAIVDARNLFDFQTGVTGEEGVLRLNSQRRALRGGILVKF